MLDSLKQAGMAVGREPSRARESLSEGWHQAEAPYENVELSVCQLRTGIRTARSVPVR